MQRLEPGTRLRERYTVQRLLGEGGGMGAVYLAADATLEGAPVAIKCMSTDGLSPAARAAFAAQFTREAHLLASLQHPNLVRVTDFFEESGHPYLVMTYIEGRTLMDVLRESPQGIDPLQVKAWMRDVLDALEYLHSRNPPVILRDLKPGNLMLDHLGHIRIIDFGIAREMARDQHTATVIKGAGTAGFAPIEQYSTGARDGRTDLYAAGATMYMLMTNVRPPSAVDLATGVKKLVPPMELNAAVPPDLNRLVLHMMALRKEQRPASAAEVKRAMIGPAAAPVVSPVPVSDVSNGRAGRRVDTVLSSIAGFALAWGMALALAYMWGSGRMWFVAGFIASTIAALLYGPRDAPPRLFAVLATAIFGGLALGLLGTSVGRTDYSTLFDPRGARLSPAALSLAMVSAGALQLLLAGRLRLAPALSLGGAWVLGAVAVPWLLGSGWCEPAAWSWSGPQAVKELPAYLPAVAPVFAALAAGLLILSAWEGSIRGIGLLADALPRPPGFAFIALALFAFWSLSWLRAYDPGLLDILLRLLLVVAAVMALAYALDRSSGSLIVWTVGLACVVGGVLGWFAGLALPAVVLALHLLRSQPQQTRVTAAVVSGGALYGIVWVAVSDPVIPTVLGQMATVGIGWGAIVGFARGMVEC